MFKRTKFLERRHLRKQNSTKKRRSENNFLRSWRRIFFKTGRDYHKRSSAQSLTFSFEQKSVEKDVFQRFFFEKKEEEDFAKKFKKFRFFTWWIEPGVLAHCNVSLTLHQYARSPRVWSDRACGAVRSKN